MLQFQKTIATSQMTLPIVGVLCVILWMLLPQPANTPPDILDFSGNEYGLWALNSQLSTLVSQLSSLVPAAWQYSPLGGWGASLTSNLSPLTSNLISKAGALAFTALAVYIMAELNNTHVLLRISSRMLSSMLAALMTFSLINHTLQPGHIAAIFILLSFFTLFHSYQLPHPTLTLTTYLLISLASLVFVKILFLLPIYWFIQAYIRALSFRCFVASLLAVLLPYWIYGGIAIATHSLPLFIGHVTSLYDISLYDYTQLTLSTILTFSFIALLFIIGTIDFYRNSFLDKTRTRILYNVVIIHGTALLLFIALQPQYFTTLLPLLIIDTSIVFGHFVALTYNRFSHILCIVLVVMATIIMVGLEVRG